MKNVFVAGHGGMVGSAICRQLADTPDLNIIVASRSDLDLLNQADVKKFFDRHQIDEVYLAAAKVGGIHANNVYPASFLYENLTIQSNVTHAAYEHGVNRLLFLGSSCIYPKHCDQPMREEMLLTGPLEPTNEPYAIAKIAGIKLCTTYRRQYGLDYRAIMPTNLYGPGDNYHLENSHVIPALIRKSISAKRMGEKHINVWGDGSPRREFLHVDDMASACKFLMEISSDDFKKVAGEAGFVNAGSSIEYTIDETAREVMSAVGYDGNIRYDVSKPNGTPRKLLDSSKLLSLGWEAKYCLSSGLEHTLRYLPELIS